MTGGFWTGGFLRAVSMFTVIPLPRRAATGSIGRAGAATTIRWLPIVGALVGALAGLPAALIMLRHPATPTLAAVVGVVALVALSGGLHMDGLADTSDGLARRGTAAQALEIMRRSDVGPFGVIAIVLVLLLDVTALSAQIGGETVWRAPAALAVAAMTARLAAVHASRPGVRAARADGFGSLVTGTVSTIHAAGLTALTLGVGATLAVATDASGPGWVLSQGGALVVAGLAQAGLVGRLAGMTGDVYGALIEITTMLVLLGFALS